MSLSSSVREFNALFSSSICIFTSTIFSISTCNRHPIAGLAAAYASVSGGWTANLLLGSNDPLYAGMLTQAANILNPDYVVQPTGNWYFMVASTVLVVLIGTWVTDHIVESHLPLYQPEEDARVQDLTLDEKKGMRAAGFAALAYIVVMLSLADLSPPCSLNKAQAQIQGFCMKNGAYEQVLKDAQQLADNRAILYIGQRLGKAGRIGRQRWIGRSDSRASKTGANMRGGK